MEKAKTERYAAPTHAEWDAERRAMETLDTFLAGRRIFVTDVGPREKGELGYTSRGSVIHVARDHERYRRFTKKEAAAFRFGVNVHEALHQVYTDFDTFYETAEGIGNLFEQQMFAQIFNLIEDPAIENFADQAVGGYALDALYFCIEKIYEDALPVSGPQNHGQALEEYLDALIQFGDRGIIKGGFSSDVAREYFNRTAPTIYLAINEPDGAERVKMAMDVYNIAKALWAGKPASRTQEAFQSVTGRYAKSGASGSGSGKTPQRTEDARNARREKEMREQGKKEDEALRKDAGYGEGQGENSQGQDAGREPDSKAANVNGSKAGNEAGNDTDSGNGSGDNSKTGNETSDGADSPGDATDKTDSAGDAGDTGSGKAGGSDGSGEDPGGRDGGADGGAEENDEKTLIRKNAGHGSADNGFSEKISEEDGSSDSGKAAGSQENGDSTTADVQDGDGPVFRYDPDIADRLAEALKQYMDQAGPGPSPDRDEEKPVSYAETIRSENRQFSGAREKNVIASPAGMGGAYADILDMAAWITGPLVTQLKKIFTDDRGGKAYAQRGKASLKRIASGRATTRVFERRVMPGDKADMCLMLLVDLSGSMSGSKELAAKLAAIVLCEAFACFRIPVYCMGFQHVHGADAYQTHFVRWRNTVEERMSILSATPSGNNFDSYSIRYATEALRKRPEKHKLMCVVSDGLPSHFFTGHEGIKENARAIQDARLAGADVFGIAIEQNDADSFQKMYGKGYSINVTCPEDLADQAAGLIKTVVKGW